MKIREEDRREEVLPFCGLSYKDLKELDCLKVLFHIQEMFLTMLKDFVLETLNCEVWK
jgi:hypothetical protein